MPLSNLPRKSANGVAIHDRGNLTDTIRRSTWGGTTRPQSAWQNGRQYAVALALKV